MSKQWGAAPVCPACKKSVYPLEEVFAADRKRFHKDCLQCKAKGCRHQTGGVRGGDCRLIFSAPVWPRRIFTSTRTATTSAANATTRSTDPGWGRASRLDRLRLRVVSAGVSGWGRGDAVREEGQAGQGGRAEGQEEAGGGGGEDQAGDGRERGVQLLLPQGRRNCRNCPWIIYLSVTERLSQ